MINKRIINLIFPNYKIEKNTSLIYKSEIIRPLFKKIKYFCIYIALSLPY